MDIARVYAGETGKITVHTYLVFTNVEMSAIEVGGTILYLFEMHVLQLQMLPGDYFAIRLLVTQ